MKFWLVLLALAIAFIAAAIFVARPCGPRSAPGPTIGGSILIEGCR